MSVQTRNGHVTAESLARQIDALPPCTTHATFKALWSRYRNARRHEQERRDAEPLSFGWRSVHSETGRLPK